MYQQYYNGYPKRRFRWTSNWAPVNTILIIINVVAFFIMEFVGDTDDVYFMLDAGASYMPYVIEHHEYWRLFTCMFMHFGIQHLVNNMVVLWFLGDNLERAMGKVKYLITYLGSGFLANIICILIEYRQDSNAVSAGASGAIFAVTGGLIYVLAYHRGHYEDLSLQRIIVYVAMNIYLGLQDSHTDNAAHIAGLVCGFVITMILYREPKKRKSDNPYYGNYYGGYGGNYYR